MKKLKFLGLALLVFVLFFAACDSSGGGGGDSDTWRYASVSDLNGTWKGSASVTKSMKEWGQMWEWTLLDSDYDEYFGNMNMKVTREITLLINGGQATESTTTVESFSGGKVNTGFPMLAEWWASDNPIVDYSKYTMTYNYNGFAFTYSDNNRWIQINQDDRKIKLTGQSIYDAPVEYILNKQ